MSQTTQSPVGASALAGEGSPCPEITFEGKTYRLGWNTRKAKQALEQLVAWNATTSIEELRGVAPPAQLADMERELIVALRARQHWTYGTLWCEAINGPAGTTLFVASLLREHVPSATLEELFHLAREMVREGSVSFRAALAQTAPPFVKELVRDAPVAQEDREATAQKTLAEIGKALRFTGAAPE